MTVSQHYFQTSNISRSLVGNKLVDDLDVVGSALQLYLHSGFNTWLRWIGQLQLEDENESIQFKALVRFVIRNVTVDLVMAWHLIGNKPLPAATFTKNLDMIQCH